MKKRIVKQYIESDYDPPLYRYHVEFSNGETLGSCYCYKSYEEAIKNMEQTLKWVNKC